MIRIELALSLILDISRPVSAKERESMITMLEAAEDYRMERGVIASPDIARARVLLNGTTPTDAPALAPPTLVDVERRVLVEALRRHHGNRTHAAADLGITVRTVRNIIRRERIDVAAGVCVHTPEGSPR